MQKQHNGEDACYLDAGSHDIIALVVMKEDVSCTSTKGRFQFKTSSDLELSVVRAES